MFSGKNNTKQRPDSRKNTKQRLDSSEPTTKLRLENLCEC